MLIPLPKKRILIDCRINIDYSLHENPLQGLKTTPKLMKQSSNRKNVKSRKLKRLFFKCSRKKWIVPFKSRNLKISFSSPHFGDLLCSCSSKGKHTVRGERSKQQKKTPSKVRNIIMMTITAALCFLPGGTVPDVWCGPQRWPAGVRQTSSRFCCCCCFWCRPKSVRIHTKSSP